MPTRTTLTPPENIAVIVALAQQGAAPRSLALAAVLARDQDVRRALAEILRGVESAKPSETEVGAILREAQAGILVVAAEAMFGKAWRQDL